MAENEGDKGGGMGRDSDTNIGPNTDTQDTVVDKKIKITFSESWQGECTCMVKV